MKAIEILLMKIVNINLLCIAKLPSCRVRVHSVRIMLWNEQDDLAQTTCIKGEVMLLSNGFMPANLQVKKHKHCLCPHTLLPTVES